LKIVTADFHFRTAPATGGRPSPQKGYNVLKDHRCPHKFSQIQSISLLQGRSGPSANAVFRDHFTSFLRRATIVQCQRTYQTNNSCHNSYRDGQGGGIRTRRHVGMRRQRLHSAAKQQPERVEAHPTLPYPAFCSNEALGHQFAPHSQLETYTEKDQQRKKGRFCNSHKFCTELTRLELEEMCRR
jgi:hypothetical protein